jgi:excisionase family DNA binding protein
MIRLRSLHPVPEPSMNRPVQPYLSTADAARVLGVTPATVRQMHQRGALPIANRTEGGIHLFHRSDVEALARQRDAADAGTR